MTSYYSCHDWGYSWLDWVGTKDTAHHSTVPREPHRERSSPSVSSAKGF